MSLLSLISRRLILLPFALILIVFVVFGLFELIPADPAILFAGPDATEDMLESARQKLGLDQPFVLRFLKYLFCVAQGDFGVSISTREPVLDSLLRYMPATIELTTTSIFVAVVLGLPIGILSAVRRNSGFDAVVRLLSFSCASFPVFWSGLLLQLLFYGDLKILPFGGRISGVTPPVITGLLLVDSVLLGDAGLLLNSLEHLILPSITLSTITFAVVVRMVRANFLEILGEPYIQFARAKGLSNRIVLFKHAMRNAAVPVITVVTTRFSYLLGGAVVTESIFSWPGIGGLAVVAIKNVDYPVIFAFTLMTGVIFVVINLVTDIICAFVDRRIKY